MLTVDFEPIYLKTRKSVWMPREVMWDRPTYLVVDARPEAAAHVAAAIVILHDQPAELVLDIMLGGPTRQVSLTIAITIVSRVRRVDSGAARRRPSDRSVCLFQLPSQLLNQVLQCSQSLRDLSRRRFGLCSGIVGNAFETTSPSWAAVGGGDDAGDICATAVRAGRELIASDFSGATDDAAAESRSRRGFG